MLKNDIEEQHSCFFHNENVEDQRHHFAHHKLFEIDINLSFFLSSNSFRTRQPRTDLTSNKMNNQSILDQTVLPTITAATRYAADLYERTTHQRPATPPAADAQPNPDDSSDENSETSPDESSDKKSETSSSPESISSSQKDANTTLDEFDEMFMPSIKTIILARDQAQREGRPFPPAWSRLRRPADMPLPAYLDMPEDLILPANTPLPDDDTNNVPDRLNETFVPTIRRRPIVDEPLDEGKSS
ncbi:hypothetical protein F4680DRAFT_405782 [Xylaria scruposa]|nr:hypothetical protein F4680DRAFT_405782 [Xylaria scruposa]